LQPEDDEDDIADLRIEPTDHLLLAARSLKAVRNTIEVKIFEVRTRERRKKDTENVGVSAYSHFVCCRSVTPSPPTPLPSSPIRMIPAELSLRGRSPTPRVCSFTHFCPRVRRRSPRSVACSRTTSSRSVRRLSASSGSTRAPASWVCAQHAVDSELASSHVLALRRTHTRGLAVPGGLPERP